jgi:hypothetical protein
MQADLPLGQIKSKARFVLFCKEEGLLSGHAQPSEALHSLSAYLQESTKSAPNLRTYACWVGVDVMIFKFVSGWQGNAFP